MWYSAKSARPNLQATVSGGLASSILSTFVTEGLHFPRSGADLQKA
jgi:hypothetical protein